MDTDLTRRALVGAILAGGVGASTFSPIRGYLERFAPLSGSAWDATDPPESRTIESPYGTAEVRYDEYGVPNVTGESEEAVYFAVGYAQARDRAFQLDLQRRQMRGELSAVVGDQTLDSDEFNVKMDFAGAAQVTWESLADSRAGALTEAYAAGVNEIMTDDPSALEFSLLEYEPDPWTPVDTILMQKQIAWTLTGSFRTLRTALVADRLGEEVANELYPSRLDHESPIIRDQQTGQENRKRARSQTEHEPSTHTVDPALADWLSQFESPSGIGSNSWVVSGEHTASGAPIVANDPHLSLMAPPVWYEMNLSLPETSVRGVTFPGVPFVVIGENDAGAWGFTNTGVDVIDFYRYDTRDGEYRYEGEWREFDTEQRTIAVSDGEDRQVTVRKTVHGPVIEREGARVGVAWTGHTAESTPQAIYEFSRSEGVDDIVAATENFDVPTQNLVYADRDGNTLYYVTGKIPIRTTDGEEVPGDRIFDGSASEGEWQGFTPFGTSSWEGFVPFEEKPHVMNPNYIGTANQRVVDDPEHYLAEAYSDPYRGIRIYDRLDRRVRSDEPIDPEFVKDLQRDTLDLRAEALVPLLVEVARAADDTTAIGQYVDALDEWDHRMDRDSLAALVFARWFEQYRERVFGPTFSDHDLDASYYPNDWVLQHLGPNSRWFEGRSRAEVMLDALDAAIERIENAEYDTYGGYNTTGAMTHPLGLAFLNYPAMAVDGSRETVNNYAVENPTGSSWRMVCPMDGSSSSVIPGGNSGEYFSDHYDDQLRMWADVEYKSMSREIQGETTLTFEGEDGQ
ncbi:penicillin acylase family protein [Halococcus saccharolyticus]|uniref:Peptidase S45 penicillin amidase n=1 Tax=Halococcus saccharolyticus DSM 5350 TaxID=1227455 RepID=M0MQG9_9EURY|nr:penicillin acylase family protein [Halococcus saccharolyticus]EMA47568.1 peptidase S45 penicillin amidase [Halococcus saccharolyticus DSM 5350]